MESARGFLIFKRQGQEYKVRVADIKRLYKVNQPNTPKIPCFENHPFNEKLMNED